MPGFDGTGPLRKGPFTGKGMGYCIIKVDSENNEKQKSKGEEVFNMPRGDGTGPMGLGPMTGKAMGYCAGYVNPVSGRGYFGGGRGFFGRGGGRGRRNLYYATGLTGWQRSSMGMPAFDGEYPYAPEITPKQEADLLKKEADFLKNQLQDIQGRIEVLEKARTEKSK